MAKEKEPNLQGIKRKFGPTYLSLKNKTTVYIFSVLLVFVGLFSCNQMPRELMPEVVIPFVFVQTVYPGNSPVEIENHITRPIEKELKGMQGLSKVSSGSHQDVSTIWVEFNTNVGIQQALQDTRDRVDKARTELPDDLDTDPLVMDINFSEFPILNVNLSGDFSMRDLKRYAEILQDEFEGLREISGVDIRGVEEREIQINVDPFKLDAVGLTFEDIALAVQFENLTIGAGEFTADNTR